MLDTLVEMPAIVEVRQRVSDGKVRQGPLGLLSLGDISDDRQASDDFTDLGIRIAMGARRGQVIGLVVRETLRTVGFGVLVGFAVIVAPAPALEGLLFNIGTTDPLTFVGGAVILMGVAGLAAYITARRAAGADPIQVLRRA